jgi:putative ABC transport system ATP-binding protein
MIVATARIAIRCRGLTKDFRERDACTQALRGVDLDVYTGQLTLLVGPSGCGKTTLMSAVAGTLDPSSGNCHVFGQDLVHMRAADKIRFRCRYIGFVFQQFNLLPALTAVENASVPLRIAGWPRRRALEAATQLLERLGMQERLHHYPRQLSGGQQQRVAVARALVHEPRLVVCDEPTSSLDSKTGSTVLELLRAVAVHPGRAVLVATHDNRIGTFGDRAAYMDDGRIIAVEEKTHGPSFSALRDASPIGPLAHEVIA